MKEKNYLHGIIYSQEILKKWKKKRMCVRNRVTSEKEIDIKKIQNHITDWENN